MVVFADRSIRTAPSGPLGEVPKVFAAKSRVLKTEMLKELTGRSNPVLGMCFALFRMADGLLSERKRRNIHD
jgi:hypothetical protein